MNDIERRVLDHMKGWETLQDDPDEYVVIVPAGAGYESIAAALELDVEAVTEAVDALAERQIIIGEGNANYGPIVAIYDWEAS